MQLYIHQILSSVAQPIIQLKASQRVHLKAGKTKTISFLVSPDMLSLLDKNLDRIVEPDDFAIMIGASSRDIRLEQTLTVQ